MNSPEDFLMLVDLEVCADNLARELALVSNEERVDSLTREILQLVDKYEPNHLRVDAPSLLIEVGTLMLEVAIRRMKAEINV